jgi:hypothetical protein
MQLVMVAALVALTIAAPYVQAGETKYATGTASAVALFGPRTGQTVVKSLYATCDKENGAIKFYDWNEAAVLSPTAAPTNGQSTIYVTNTGYPLTTNDTCVYKFASGAVLYRTISAATTTNVTLNSALNATGSTSDKIYEITQGGQIVVGLNGATVGTNHSILADGGAVYSTPGGSPLYVVLDATSNAVLQVTVE